MTTSIFPALELDARTIAAANDASQYEAGRVLAEEAAAVYTNGLQDLTPAAEWNEAQRAYALRRADEWRDLVQKAYNDIIRRRASWMPWTVCGPARYNSRRNSARADAQMAASQEWREKMERFRANTVRTLRGLVDTAQIVEEYRRGLCSDPISSDDPAAVEKLTARIEWLKEEHAAHLVQNRHYRKHGTMQGAPGIDGLQAARLDAKLAALPECMRVVGFPSNETATIRRLEQRLQQITKEREAQKNNAAAPVQFEGLTIKECPEDNRLRLYFDEKPAAETRETLKRSGFRWSPSAGAWQRQLTEAARRETLRLVDSLGYAPIAAQPRTITPEELTDLAQADK